MSIQYPQIVVHLREAMEKHRVRTGVRFTYATLARATGISEATLQSLAARRSYNTRLNTIAKLCTALECDPSELLELVRGPNRQ